VQLERVAAELRPRSGWEAVDLGFRMVQVWWRPIYGAWLALALPLCALLVLAFPGRLWLAGLALWWLLPLLERLPLWIASEALFGHVPGIGETLRRAPRLFARQWISALGFRRLSPVRSFTQPVVLLEGLEGSAQRERIRALRWRSGGTAALLGLVCFGIEFVTLSLGLLGAALWLAPEIADVDLFLLLGGAAPRAWYAFAYAAFAASLLLLGPFYAVAGFSLYIHRRIYLEGWDVELSFRSLARRAAGQRGAIALGLLVLLAPAAPAGAGPERDPARAHDVLERVFDEPELRGWVERETWIRIGRSRQVEEEIVERPEWLVALAEWIARLLRIGLWVAAAIAALLLARWIARLAREPPAAATTREVPEVVAGFDVRPDRLPPDVIAAARAAWREGRVRDALALLYRGALAYLVHERVIDLAPGATEGECLRRVESLLDVAPDFARLTRAWQAAAYARRLPDVSQFEALCDAWSPRLGARP
jgi:hypothetical protein